MFDRLTSLSILNPPATTKLVLSHHDPNHGPFNPLSLNVAKGNKSLKAATTKLTKGAKRSMSSSHYRSSSPGGRRIANPARLSDSSYYSTLGSYPSPRASTERVIPISSTTFVNLPRTNERTEGYTATTRPRRSTLTETGRPSSSSSHTHHRSRPAIVQSQAERPSSPLSRPGRSHEPAHNQEYYVTPASSSAPRREHTHKKVYSIDEGKSHLVADIDINPARSNRRSSVDRNGYRSSTAAHTSSHRNSYHHSGPAPKRQDHVDIDSGFSYTDPAGMYRDTEPRRRPRAGSVEGARPRPSSMILEPYPARSSARELGPPTSRALDRYNGSLGLGLNRGGSLRDPVRSANHSPYQDPPPTSYAAPQDRPSSSSKRYSAAIHQDRGAERHEAYPPPSRDIIVREPHEERRDPRDTDRQGRVYEDRAVELRGFGIRKPSPDRRNPARGSDEGLGRREAYLDRAPAQPPVQDPRETAHARAARDEVRREQERRDYEYARDVERQERERLRAREPREQDRREKERLPSDQIYLSERDRERPRAPPDQPAYREQDRDRRDRDDRWSAPHKDSADGLASVLPVAVGGGLGAAAVYGAGEAAAKNRDREKDRGRQSPPDSGREDERSRRHRDQRESRATNDISPSDRERRAPGGDKDRRSREPEKDRTPADAPTQSAVDPDEEYRRRVQQAQREIATASNTNNGGAHREVTAAETAPESDHRRRERLERNDRIPYREPGLEEAPPSRSLRRSPDESALHATSISHADRGDGPARDGRVRIVDPPSKRDDQPAIKGILRKPTEKFPEDPHPIREGVAPLKDTSKDKSIPTDARWTKISRELVNPDCLKEAKERFEEREDCVIVLRVLTKEEIQKLADRTAELRYSRYEDADRMRRERRRSDKDQDRRDRDEYSDHSEDEYTPKPPRLLEGSAPGHDAPIDHARDKRRDRDRSDRDAGGGRDGSYMSGGL